MICKKIDFRDEDLDEDVKGYVIFFEDEIIVLFKGYGKEGFNKFNNLNELIAEIIHSKVMLEITEKMLDEESKRVEELEEILNALEEQEIL